MALCSICKTRHAIIFTSRFEAGKRIDEGFCLKCAYESGIAGVTDMFKATGITHKEMHERFNGSAKADIRFFMLTDLQLRNEMGMKVSPGQQTKWKLVPEDLVSSCLAKDTVNFNIVQTHTSLKWD